MVENPFGGSGASVVLLQCLDCYAIYTVHLDVLLKTLRKMKRIKLNQLAHQEGSKAVVFEYCEKTVLNECDCLLTLGFLLFSGVYIFRHSSSR